MGWNELEENEAVTIRCWLGDAVRVGQSTAGQGRKVMQNMSVVDSKPGCFCDH